MMYTRHKAKLLAAGVPPTLKNIIFLRTALGRAVSLQPLITQQHASSSTPASESESPSQSSAAAAVAATVDFEAIRAALALQSQHSQKLSAEFREVRELNGRAIADLQREMREANLRTNAELQRELREVRAQLSELKQQQQL